MVHPVRCLAPALALTLALSGTALAGPSPVGLGTSADFAVLGGSGLTNTGVTSITGDVGSSPTHGETGFTPCPAADCVSLTGANHNVADPNDAVTQQAKTDLVTAYDDAFGRTGGSAIVAPLGGGQTLVSGVYTAAGSIFVGGDLTLDAGGDPAAVFIFQARTGALTTAAGIAGGVPNTRVLLTNGAQACNVFWQVGSSATISTYTQFVGNILSLQSTTLQTSATLAGGRALSRNGAVTLDTNTIHTATCATPVAIAATPTATTPATAAAPTPTTPLATPTRTRRRVASGRATLTGPTASRPKVTVAGRSIANVVFYVDGRRVGTVRAKPGRTKFTRTISRGTRLRRVTARVTFVTGSGTTSRTLRVVVPRAAPRVPRPPRFTG